MDLVEARTQGYVSSSRHPWERARFEVLRRIIARHVPLPVGAAVLDVGCGDAFILEELARSYPGRSFLGVDTAYPAETIRHYQTQASAPSIRLYQSLDELGRPLGAPVSLVLLMDVLEHVECERDLIRDLLDRPWIGSEAWFLVTVPAYSWLFSAHDRFLGHYRRYSRASARRLLESAGLDVIESGYFFASLVPLRSLQVLVERCSGRRAPMEATDVATWQGSTVVGNTLTALLVFDERIARVLSRVGIVLPGLSVFAICRKSA